MEEEILEMPTIACSECGKEFPADQAKYKDCRGPMRCENGKCACDACGHEQPMDDMWCDDCLKKSD